MKKVIILLISVYQKYVSPYKGYRCAHAAVYGGESCSAAIKTILMENGVFGGVSLIKPRFQECRGAYELYLSQSHEEPEKDKLSDYSPCSRWDLAPIIGSSAKSSNCDLPCDCGW